MSDFNTKAGAGPDDAPSYLNALKGTPSGTEVFADLFKGVGNVAMQAVAVADQNNLNNQKTAIQQGVNQTLNDFGFRTEGNSETNTPAELQDYKRQLDLTHKAYISGSLKDSAFQMRIDALSRQVRSRYPGYDAEIDTVINQTLNRSTANDLRKEMTSQWDREVSQSNASASAWQTDLDTFTKDGVLQQVFPRYYEDRAEGKEPSPDEVRAKVSVVYADRASLDQLKKENEYLKSKGDLTKSRLVDTANQDIGQLSRTVLNTGLNDPAIKGFLDGIGTKNVGDWTDKEMQQGIGALEPLIYSTKTRMLERLSDPMYDTLSKQERDDIVSKALEPLMSAKDAVLNKDTGLLNIFKTLTDAQQSKDSFNFLKIQGEKGDPSAVYARKRGAALKIFGAEAMANFDLQNKDSADAAITSFMKTDFATPDKSIVEILEDGNKAKGDPLSAGATKEVLTAAIKLVTDPNGTPEGKARSVDMLFGEGNSTFLSKFSDKPDRFGKSDRIKAFEALTSPSVSLAVKAAGEKNPELLSKYAKSMGASFNNLFAEKIKDVVDVTKYSDYVSFAFDDNTMQFKPVYKNQGSNTLVTAAGQTTMLGSLYSLNEQWKASSGLSSMNDMNAYLRNFKPAMEAAGYDPKAVLAEVFQMNGLENSKQEGSLFTQLYSAFAKADPKGHKPFDEALKPEENPFVNTPDFKTGEKSTGTTISPVNLNLVQNKVESNTLQNIIGNEGGAPKSVQEKEVVGFVKPETNPNVSPEILNKFGDKKLPVVIRNNNPGAISMTSATKGWATKQEGFVGATARPKKEGGFYAVFATPEAGLKAAAKLLTQYGQKGIDTADEIVKKWSTDKSAWKAYSSKLQEFLGVSGDTKLDLNDKNILAKILAAQSAHESGTGKPVYKLGLYDSALSS